MLYISRPLQRCVGNQIYIRQRGAAVMLGRSTTSHLWENKDFKKFKGAVGFRSNRSDVNTGRLSIKDDLIVGENSVHFSHEDLTTPSKSEELIKVIYKVSNKMQTFEGLRLSSALQYDLPSPVKREYCLIEAIPQLDPASKMGYLIDEMIFASQVTQMPIFTEQLLLGESFISPELSKKIEGYFNKKNEEFFQVYPESIEQCNVVMNQAALGQKKFFKGLSNIYGEKVLAKELLEHIEAVKKEILRGFSK